MATQPLKDSLPFDGYTANIILKNICLLSATNFQDIRLHLLVLTCSQPPWLGVLSNCFYRVKCQVTCTRTIKHRFHPVTSTNIPPNQALQPGPALASVGRRGAPLTSLCSVNRGTTFLWRCFSRIIIMNIKKMAINSMLLSWTLDSVSLYQYPGPVLAGAGPNVRPTRGALWVVVVWRHHAQSTVLRPFWLKCFSIMA